MKTCMKIAAFFALALAATPALAQPHNIIIFVADGLRYGSVEPGNMPVMAKLKSRGVDFTNSHSLFPTVTTVNASAIATGHYIGDTGDFGNTIWTGAALAGLENDTVLAQMNQRFGGNYLNETTLIAAARDAGWQTAVIGKEGPVRIQDSAAAPDGSQTLFLDDSSGSAGGLGLPQWFSGQMPQAFLADAPPKISYPDAEQEAWLAKAATRIVLPHFAASGKPFAMLFWSRDPDITQHNARDSVGELDPGINGPTARAAARNADTMLGLLLQALKDQGVDKTTDVFVTADHGFITVAHASATSPSAQDGQLHGGFLAADLKAGLGLTNTDAIVVPNGGADLIYLPGPDARRQAGAIVKFLSAQDYVSGLFVHDRLGKLPGALPMSDVNLIGAARTPTPDIYVNFRSFALGCADPLQCTVGLNDTSLATGQGSHGSLSRAETRNFMAAIGPDFKAGLADPAPVSNADIAPTLARVMGLDLKPKGKLTGRAITEALAGGAPVKVTRRTLASDPGVNGVRTLLNEQAVGDTRYFDAAGFEGRTVGLIHGPAQH